MAGFLKGVLLIVMSFESSVVKESVGQTLIRWSYTLLLCLLIPLAFVLWKMRSRSVKAAYEQALFGRFGLVYRPKRKGGYLIHCVSVGEVVSASVLIKTLMKQDASAHFTITTTTATGAARVRDIFGDTVQHCFLPYDLPFAMNTMLKRLAPKVVLITEVELWPNMIHACWKRHIPTVVINARLTERSAQRYAKISYLFAPMLAKVSHVCAQGQRDFDHYLQLGIDAQKLTLTNNIKFDQASTHSPSAERVYKGLTRGVRPVIVAGSTHDPEEQFLLNAFEILRRHYPNLLLILVPRHPERFVIVEKMLSTTALTWSKSTDTSSISDDTDVLLINEMGKLNDAFGIGTVAFVGGSIADRGGHNALEPAAMSLPIMMGPHIYNNPVICEYLMEQGALQIVKSDTDIVELSKGWLSNPDAAMRDGNAGLSVIEKNSGAMLKTVECIRQSLD